MRYTSFGSRSPPARPTQCRGGGEGGEGEEEGGGSHYVGYWTDVPLPASPTPDASPHPVLSTNQMQLVHNKQVYILHILPLLPPPGEDVPVLRCRHDDCPLLEEAEVSTGLPRQLHYLLAQSLAKPDMPVRIHLSRACKHTDRQTDRQTDNTVS